MEEFKEFLAKEAEIDSKMESDLLSVKNQKVKDFIVRIFSIFDFFLFCKGKKCAKF